MRFRKFIWKVWEVALCWGGLFLSNMVEMSMGAGAQLSEGLIIIKLFILFGPMKWTEHNSISLHRSCIKRVS